MKLIQSATILCLVLCGLALADVRSEAALKAQLEKAQSTLSTMRVETAKRSQQAAEERHDSNEAAVVANQQAVDSAIAAKGQADQLTLLSSHNNMAVYATLITTAFGFLTLISQFAWKAFTDSRNHKWAVDDSKATALLAAANRRTDGKQMDTIQAGVKISSDEAEKTQHTRHALVARIAAATVAKMRAEEALVESDAREAKL